MKKSFEKQIESHLTKTTNNSILVFLGRVIGYILGYTISFILAKLFGAEITGQYNLIKTIISYITIFTVFGLDNGLLKYISKYRAANDNKKISEIIKTSFFLGLLFSTIGTLILFFMRQQLAHKIFEDGTLIMPLAIGALVIIPNTFNILFSGIYRGYELFRYYSIGNNILRRLVFILFLIFFYYYDIKETYFVVFALLVSYMINLAYLSYNTSKLNLKFNKVFLGNDISFTNTKKRLVKFSSTLIFISFMGLILSNIDKIMIGIYMNSESVGVYSVGSQITTLVNFIFVSTNIVFASVISKLYSSNKMKLLEKLYSIITKWIIVLTLPILLSMIFFSVTIMSLFGSDFIEGSRVIIILAIAQGVNSFVGANAYLLKMTNNHKIVLLNNTIISIINVLLNNQLIPIYGIEGAAIATGLSIVIINVIQLIEVKKILNIFPYDKNYWKLIPNILFVFLNNYLILHFYNNIIGVVLITFINIVLSIFISYKFSVPLEKKIISNILDKFI